MAASSKQQQAYACCLQRTCLALLVGAAELRQRGRGAIMGAFCGAVVVAGWHRVCKQVAAEKVHMAGGCQPHWSLPQ